MPDWLARLRSPIAIVLGTQLAIIALAFWLGRWSASLGDPSEARAQEPAESSTFTSSPPPDEPSAAREADEDPPAASRASNPPASAAVAEMTAADRALLERRNLFTIKVAEYRNNDTSRELAMRAYRHLAQHNFPVCTPYLAGSSIYLMVGAAPQAQTMENELLPQIKSLLGPDGKNKDFATAYIVRIDHLVSR